MFTGTDRTQLTRIEAKLDLLLAKEGLVMKELDDLTAEVTVVKDGEAAAIVLINGIAARITAAGVDPAALAALTSSLTTSASALGAAVVANTPAA